MKNSKYLLPFIILLGFLLCSCSASNNVDKKQMENDLQEQIVNASSEDHENHDYDEDCEECPPSKNTDDIEIDGPGGTDPNWSTESDNPTEWPKQTDVTNTHGNHDYDEDCEECPPPRITDGIEIDGPGGMNPNWPTESDNPNEWPKNTGDLENDDESDNAE